MGTMGSQHWETFRLDNPGKASDDHGKQQLHGSRHGLSNNQSLAETRRHSNGQFDDRRTPNFVSNTEQQPAWETATQMNQWIVQQQKQQSSTPVLPLVHSDNGQIFHRQQQKRSSSPQERQGASIFSSKRPRYGQPPPRSPHDDYSADTSNTSPMHREYGKCPRLLRELRLTRSLEYSERRLKEHAANSEGQADRHMRRRSDLSNGFFEQRCDQCLRGKDLMLETADDLTKLAASLTSGAWSHVSNQLPQPGSTHSASPQAAELHRMLDLLVEVNQLARQLERFAPTFLAGIERASQDQRGIDPNGSSASIEVMKRRLLHDPDENFRRLSQGSSPGSATTDGAGYSSPRGQLQNQSAGHLDGKKLPPIQSHSPASLPPDGYGSRLPSMQPPPPPYRQTNSPPPTSYSLPSPTPTTYARSSLGSLPPYAGTSSVTSHPGHPLSPPPSTAHSHHSIPLSPAIQAHTAALQHEVSRQTYALSTLQAEHDKLLGALNRSRTRAQALEEKANVSEREVCELAEEKDALERRVKELEEEVRMLKQMREEERVGRVKERGQYVEMLRLGALLEKRVGAIGTNGAEEGVSSTGTNPNTESCSTGASVGQLADAGSTTQPSVTGIDTANEVSVLRTEVRTLKKRIMEVEAVLRTVQEESKFEEDAAQKAAETRARVRAQVEQALTEDNNSEL